MPADNMAKTILTAAANSGRRSAKGTVQRKSATTGSGLTITNSESAQFFTQDGQWGCNELQLKTEVLPDGVKLTKVGLQYLRHCRGTLLLLGQVVCRVSKAGAQGQLGCQCVAAAYTTTTHQAC